MTNVRTPGGGWGQVELTHFRVHFRIVFDFVLCLSVYPCSVVSQLFGTPPGSSVPGISQARRLDWLAISSSRGSSRPRDRTHVSCISCIAGGFFTPWATGEACHTLCLHYVLKLRKNCCAFSCRGSRGRWRSLCVGLGWRSVFVKRPSDRGKSMPLG